MGNISGDSQLDTSSYTARVVPIVALFALVYLLHLHATKDRIPPKGIPWVGPRNECFSITRAHIREWWEGKSYIEEGYLKYSKIGKPFLTPTRIWKPEVVLPPSYMSWLIDQPDSILSIYAVLIENVEFKYTSPRSWQFHRAFHVEALNKMRLDLMTDAIVDEIDIRTRETFGEKPGVWEDVILQRGMWDIIASITNRVFVGKELAHDHKYYEYSCMFIIRLLVQSTYIWLLCPAVLKPLLGHIIALPCRYYDRRCSEYLVPTIQKHLQEAEEAKHTHHETRNPDMLQLMARFAVKSDDPRDRDPRSLASRLLALNFVGIHTSSAAAINACVDILVSDPSLYATLRGEAATVLRDAGGKWTKPAVNKLVVLDSTLRESLRFSSFKARGVERQVVAKQGVNLPDGSHLPFGAKLGMPTVEIHMDEAYYERANEFVYDRFVGKAELGMVNTTDTFLAFGHGRHACPGRFFSTHELKLLFAHMLLNYDFKFMNKRPDAGFVSDFYAIKQDIRLEVCRREKSAHLD